MIPIKPENTQTTNDSYKTRKHLNKLFNLMRGPAQTADRCGPAWWDQASAKDPPLQHPPKPHQHLRQHCEQLLALSSSQLAHFLRQCRLVRGVIGQYFAGLLSPTLGTNIILGILPVEGTKRPILVLRAVINSWLNTQSFEKPGFCGSYMAA